MKFSDSLEDGVVVFQLSGKIMSCEDAMPMMARIKEHVEGSQREFIIDMTGVPWMNSQGVGLLAWAWTTIRGTEGKLALAGLSDKTHHILELTGFADIFPTYKTLEDALRRR